MSKLNKVHKTGITRFLWLRRILVDAKRFWLMRVFGMDIHKTVEMSLSAHFDTTFPKGVHVGAWSYVAFDVRMLTHDRTRGLYLDTYIGENCFIGGRSLILPGVRIGNNCVIGAGSVITRDVPDNCIAAGNPARVIREGIDVGQYGKFASADAMEHKLVEEAGI